MKQLDLEFVSPLTVLPPEAEAGQALSTAGRDLRIARLVPLCLELAVAAGRDGIIVGDLREAAVARGLLADISTGRELSWLYQVPKAAKLIATTRTRRSKVKVSHGNLQRIYVAREEWR